MTLTGNLKPEWVPPPIPLALAHRPTVGGLAVPWVTLAVPDGRFLFGGIDAGRHDRALHERLCQTCGNPLQDRIVFAMREGDLARMLSPEAGMHPWCARYASRSCPMLGGAVSHYRSTSPLASLPPGTGITLDTNSSRLGAAADKYQLVWVRNYRPMLDPVTKRWAAMVLPGWIARIRPTSGAG